MRYLTLSELVYMNGVLLKDQALLGGKKQIRAMELLEAAAARPAASAFGEDAYPTLREKVAALFHSLVRNHPFTDGNKRTATLAALFMFYINGERITWQFEDALAMILDVAEGKTSFDQLAAWFPLESTGVLCPVDAEADMARIASLVSEHKGLLDELEKR